MVGSQACARAHTQVATRLDRINAHQAALRAGAHKSTLEAAVAKVGAMSSSLGEVIQNETAAAAAAAAATAQADQLENKAALQKVAASVTAAKAELLARMDAQYQDVRSQAVEASALGGVILKETAAREADTTATRGLVSDLSTQMKALAGRVDQVQSATGTAQAAADAAAAAVLETGGEGQQATQAVAATLALVQQAQERFTRQLEEAARAREAVTSSIAAVKDDVGAVKAKAAEALKGVRTIKANAPLEEVKWRAAIEEEANNRMTDAGYVRLFVQRTITHHHVPRPQAALHSRCGMW